MRKSHRLAKKKNAIVTLATICLHDSKSQEGSPPTLSHSDGSGCSRNYIFSDIIRKMGFLKMFSPFFANKCEACELPKKEEKSIILVQTYVLKYRFSLPIRSIASIFTKISFFSIFLFCRFFLKFFLKCNQNCLKNAGNPRDMRRFQVRFEF